MSDKRPTIQEVLEELESRFLLNVPEDELKSTERLFFQIEQSYWFYEDFYADQYSHLPHFKLKEFAKRMFDTCTLLQPLQHQYDEHFSSFKSYVTSVPVMGCIILNKAQDKVVLVCNWKGTAWSFPRGKVNQGESEVECAAREVMEETGCDVSSLISPSSFLDFRNKDQNIKLFIVAGIDESYPFETKTRKEISQIAWFPIDSVPKNSYAVLPFMGRLKRWIRKGPKKNAHRSPGRSNSNSRSRKSAKSNGGGEERSSSVPTKAKNGRRSPSRTDQGGSGANNSGRPKSASQNQKIRGHFGTETETSKDLFNEETFDGAKHSSWTVEDMFAVNESLTGKKFVYDGNPHDFGSVRLAASQGKEEEESLEEDATSSEPTLSAPVAAFFQNFAASATNSSLGQVRPLPQSVSPAEEPPREQQGSEEEPAVEVEEERRTSLRVPNNIFGNFQFDTVSIMGCVG